MKNIPVINAYFSKIDILHGYNATKTVSGIQSSIDFYNNVSRDINGNFVNPPKLEEIMVEYEEVLSEEPIKYIYTYKDNREDVEMLYYK